MTQGTGLVAFIFGAAFIFFLVLVGRFVGAWMLRINEVITEQEKTNKYLKSINDKLESNGSK